MCLRRVLPDSDSAVRWTLLHLVRASLVFPSVSTLHLTIGDGLLAVALQLAYRPESSIDLHI